MSAGSKSAGFDKGYDVVRLQNMHALFKEIDVRHGEHYVVRFVGDNDVQKFTTPKTWRYTS